MKVNAETVNKGALEELGTSQTGSISFGAE